MLLWVVDMSRQFIKFGCVSQWTHTDYITVYVGFWLQATSSYYYIANYYRLYDWLRPRSAGATSHGPLWPHQVTRDLPHHPVRPLDAGSCLGGISLPVFWQTLGKKITMKCQPSLEWMKYHTISHIFHQFSIFRCLKVHHLLLEWFGMTGPIQFYFRCTGLAMICQSKSLDHPFFAINLL